MKFKKSKISINKVVEAGVILVTGGSALVFFIWSKNNFLLPKETYAESILIVLLAIYLIKVVEDGRFYLVKSNLWYPLLGIAGASLFSLINSVSFYLSFLDLAEFLSYFFILFLAVNFIRTWTQKTRIFWALVVVCIITSAYAVCQFYNLEFKFWVRQGGRGNIFSTFGNPNRYSGWVGAVVPVMICYFFTMQGVKKYILGTSIALTYTGMMMTFTRGALLGLVVSLSFMLFLLLRFLHLKFFKKYKAKIFYLISIFAIISVVFSTKNPINISGQTIIGRFVSAATGQEASLRQRLMIWQVSFLMARAHPFIGQGIGTYKYHYLWYQGKFFENPANQNRLNLAVWAREAHNEYLQILVEMGALGLFFWLWLIFTFFGENYRGLKKEKNQKHFLMRLGLGTGAFVILVHAAVSFPLHIVPNGILLFLLMGLATSTEQAQTQTPASGFPKNFG